MQTTAAHFRKYFKPRRIALLVGAIFISPAVNAQSLTPPHIYAGTASLPADVKAAWIANSPFNFVSDYSFKLADRGMDGVFGRAEDYMVSNPPQDSYFIYFQDPMFGTPGKIVELYCSTLPDRSDARQITSGITRSSSIDWSGTEYLVDIDSINTKGYERPGVGPLNNCIESPIAMRPNGAGGVAWKYDPQPYPFSAKEISYWTVTRNPDGSGTPVSSNIATIKPFFSPQFLNKNDKISPGLFDGYKKEYQQFVAAGSGRIKIASVVNPNSTYGVGTNIRSSGAKFGTIDVVGNDVFYTPGAQFGVGENINADEFITVTASNTATLVGDQVPSDLLGFQTSNYATYQITPYSPATQGNPVFRLVNTINGIQNNIDLPGASTPYRDDFANKLLSAKRNVFSFKPNVEEPTIDIYHTPPTDPNIYWNPSMVNMQSVFLVQTGGAPCPLLVKNTEGDPYATIKKYLAYQPEVSTACIIEEQSSLIPNNAFSVERGNTYTSFTEFSSVERFQFTSTRNGKGTVQAKVSEIDKNGTVVRSQTLKYERNVLYPDFFDYTLANNFTFINNHYIVTDRNKDLVSVLWNTPDRSNLGVKGSLKLASDVRTFDTGYVSQEFFDKRAVIPVAEPGNKIKLYAFNISKETVPISTGSRRPDGSVYVTFGGPSVTGHYIVKLMRLSASTNIITEIPLPDSSWNLCNNSAEVKTPYIRPGCTSTILLPKELVNSVNAAEDRLFLNLDATQYPSDFDGLRADDFYNEYFVRKFPIPGFEGNVTLPDATLVVPHPGLKGKPIEASLSNRRNIARVTWTMKSLSDPALSPIITTRRNSTPLDLNALQPGAYTVQADIYNEVDDLVRSKETQFSVYQNPNVVLRTPTAATVGRSVTLSADVSNVPAGAVTKFQVGYDIVPATLSDDGKKISATYIPSMKSLSSKVSLSIQLSTADEFSYVTFDGQDMTIDAAPVGFIESKAKVFWIGKGETIRFVGDSAAKRIDWLVTRPDNQVVTTSTANINPFNTQSLTEGNNSIVAKVYNSSGDSYSTEALYVSVYKQPKATFSISNIAPANQTINLVAKTSNIPPNAIVTWRIGDEIVPAVPTESGEIITAYKMPAIGGSYALSLVVQVDPQNSYSFATFSGPKLNSIAYTKITANVTTPKVLDVGEEALYKATIKPSWDTQVLPLTGDGLAGEWELPDGTRVPGLTLRWTPTTQDYDRYLAGKKPIFRAWLQGAEESTMNTVQTSVTMLEPWIMPSYSLIPKGGTTQVVAPSNVILKLTPNRSVLSSILRLRGVQYEWSIPQSENISTKITNDIAVIEIKGEGTFPFSVRTFDKYGTEVTSTINIDATNAALSMTKLQFIPSPQSTRVPVNVGFKIATQSTHPKERVNRYVVTVDGQLAYDAKTVKPVQITQAGDHEIKFEAISNYGNKASMTSSFNAAPNSPPQCTLFKVSYGKIGSTLVARATPNCRDYDGKIKRMQWSVNGIPNNNSLQVQSYTFAPDETSVTIAVTVTDDSGDSTTYEQVIPRI